MDAMKEALKRKMMSAQSGAKPDLAIMIDAGKPVPDQEMVGQKTEGDAITPFDKKKLREENDLAPESDESGLEEGQEGSKLDALVQHEQGEGDLLRKILTALSGSGSQGREPNGLGERAAVGARAKLQGLMKKA